MQLKKLDRKGDFIVGSVTVLLVIIASLIVGLIVVQNFVSAMDSDLNSGDFSGGWNNTKTMANSGFNIMPVVILIAAAIPVIAAVLMLGRE